MAYICHDNVKSSTVFDVKGLLSRIAKWALSARSDQYLDPHNEHLQRDVGVTVADNPAVFKSAPMANQMPYSIMGTNIRFIDLFLSEHLNRGPR